ncbi:MAG: ABC transporter ATP-binding protein [Elusimicrobia bacterium]|nr:ABC transporter ATP-binding protein [Elusimicrobiota bacterium]
MVARWGAGRAAMPLARLLAYARRHRGTIWAASACSIINKIFDIAPEVLIGVAVDVVVSGRTPLSRLGIADRGAQLAVLAALTVLIWVLESTFQYLYQLRWRLLAQTLQHELRLDAWRHVQRLDMSWFEDRRAGDLTAALNDDVNQLERFLDNGANSLIQTAATVVLIGGIFFWIAPQVAVLAMAPIPFIVAGAFWYERRAEPLYAAVRERAALISARLSGDVSGIATIKSFAAEERELEAVRRDSLDYGEANARAIRVSSAFIPLIRMAVLAGFVATLIVGGRMAIAGTLAVGSFGVLVFLTQRLLWPLTGLAETVDQYQRAMASTKRVLDLLDAPIALDERGARLSRAEVRGELRFEDVRFSYPGREPALSGIALTVPAGTTAAFVGATGSGKTTLAKLVLRFHDPQAGIVRLDGRALTTLDARDLRAVIGFVSQESYLFHGTARENIAYGDPSKPFAAVAAAAKAAEAHDFISALPQGYDTLIGERGVKLSGGQRQRLALARAVLKDPAILLLDEATSAVDNETEAAIQRSLARIAVGRTTLVIAHRLSTIVKADRIFVLDSGRVAESGTHAELLARGGAYAALWRVQTGTETVSAARAGRGPDAP